MTSTPVKHTKSVEYPITNPRPIKTELSSNTTTETYSA